MLLTVPRPLRGLEEGEDIVQDVVMLNEAYLCVVNLMHPIARTLLSIS